MKIILYYVTFFSLLCLGQSANAYFDTVPIALVEATATGIVQVTIDPPDAALQGAQWRLGTGSWLNSGGEDSDVADGSYIVTFKNIKGWITPPNQLVTITAGQPAILVGVYETPGSVVAWGGVNGYGQCGLPMPNDDFVAVAAGTLFSLGLKAGGSIVAWGNTDGSANRPLNVPNPNEDFVAVAAGGYHCLGLKANGSIVAWGSNDKGESIVPEPNTNFVAVAAGGSHSLGLKADGSIVAWGDNTYGQFNVPEGNDFVSVSAVGGYNLSLKADGSIATWGNNGWGDIGMPVEQNFGFMAAAAGSVFCLGVKADYGSIVAQGWSGEVPLPNEDFIAVAGCNQSLGLKTDGSIVAWGNNVWGQCNVPEPNSGFLMVAAGWYHSLGLQHAPTPVPPEVGSLQMTLNTQAAAAGAQWRIGTGSWLSNNDTESGIAEGTYVVSFKDITGWITPPNQILTIVAGQTSQVNGTYETPGSVVAWGGVNGYGQCGLPMPNENFVAVAAGTLFSLGLKADGSIVPWGNKYYGNPGLSNVPEPNTSFVAVSARGYHGLGLKADGSIVAWGSNSSGESNVPEPNKDFVAVAAGDYHSLGLKADGSIVAWGDNSLGQCNVPVLNKGFVAVSASHISIGLTADGSVVEWGSAGWGELGVPLPNTGFTAIATGGIFDLGLKANGSILTWGYTPPLPDEVDNTAFARIAAGGSHNLGLKTDGSVVAWWSNYPADFGQCNVPKPNTGFLVVAAGTYHSLGIQHAPPPITSATGSLQVTLNPLIAEADTKWRVGTGDWLSSGEKAIDIAVGDHIVSFKNIIGWITPSNQLVTIIANQTVQATGSYKEPGSIVAWGDNTYGQCNVPEPNAGFVAVAAAVYHYPHTLGLKADGSIRIWGYYPEPVPEPNTGFVAVATGIYHSLGLKADGSIVAWGDNGFGECEVPTPNTDFVAISAAGNNSLGLKADGSIVVWGDNTWGQCNVPILKTGFVSASLAGAVCMGLTADGSVVSWGGAGWYEWTMPAPNTGFTMVSSAGHYSVGLRSNGSILTWGYLNYPEELAAMPLPNADFIAIAAEGWGGHILGLNTNGRIVAWGNNISGQCNVPEPNTGFFAVAAGNTYSLGLRPTTPITTDQTIDFHLVADKSYGDTDFTVSAMATSGLPVTFTASGNCTVSPTGTVHITGAGSGTITAHQTGNAAYNPAPDVSQTFTINKADLVITAENKTKLYNAINPPFTVTYSGFINGDTSTSLLGALLTSTTATETSTVGSYPITPSGLTSNNYNITYVDGVLIITFKGNSEILEPVNKDNSSVFNQGMTIPLKFKVYDNFNKSVAPPPNVVASFVLNVCSNTSISDVNVLTISTTPHMAFRWSESDQQWIYNLNTKSLEKGKTYQGTITLIDGSAIIFRFSLR